MKRDMRKWLSDLGAAEKKGAMPILSFPAIQLMGISVKELIADSERQATGMKMVADRVPSIASVSMMDLSVEAENFGSATHVSDNEVPTVTGRIIETEEDADALVVPKVEDGRTGLYVEAIRKACEKITDRPVFAGCIGPYSLAGRLMDVSEIMVNCYDEPDMVHKTMEKTSEFLIQYALAFKAAGAHGVVMAEPLTGLLSPALSAEFSCPYVKKIREAVADDNFLFIYHNCGNNVVQMMDAILTIGADAYHFGNSIDMEDALKAMPSDVIAMGNLDPAGILKDGTPERVYDETIAMLTRLTKYKNYVPSSGCDMPPITPWENIDMFFKAVNDFYA